MQIRSLLKVLPVLLLLAGRYSSIQAQAIKVPVKQKVVNQVNTRANNDVDKALDKGFDEIEKGIGGLFKKKKKRKNMPLLLKILRIMYKPREIRPDSLVPAAK